MARLKCSKCGNVFDLGNRLVAVVHGGFINLGPYKLLKCPACGRRSLFNVYSSVKEPVTWPRQETPLQTETPLSEEELEKKQIEESKYEKKQP